jgi:hypothetical protein
VSDDGAVFAQVHHLYGRWSHALDAGHPDLVVDDFTADGVLWVSDRGSYRGKDEIAEIARGRAGAVLHAITNVIVEGVAGDRARSHAYFHMVDLSSGQVAARGMYDDDLVREDGRWLWHRKAVDFLWRSSEYAAKAETLRRPDYGQDPNPVGHFGHFATTA